MKTPVDPVHHLYPKKQRPKPITGLSTRDRIAEFERILCIICDKDTLQKHITPWLNVKFTMTFRAILWILLPQLECFRSDKTTHRKNQLSEKIKAGFRIDESQSRYCGLYLSDICRDAEKLNGL
jgi:hypothetical protein